MPVIPASAASALANIAAAVMAMAAMAAAMAAMLVAAKVVMAASVTAVEHNRAKDYLNDEQGECCYFPHSAFQKVVAASYYS